MAAALRPYDRLRLGHPSRLNSDTRAFTLLILGHLLVFFTAMSHDEIVVEMVSQGWVIAAFAEQFELLIGFALFLCWSALTLRLAALLQRASRTTDTASSDPSVKRAQ